MNRQAMVAPFAEEELRQFQGRGGKTMTFIVSETVWKDAKSGDPVVTAIFNLIHRS